MDKALIITETVNCTRVLAEVRPGLEVFWHPASHLLFYVKAHFIEREVLSEMLPFPVAWLLNMWVLRRLIQLASSDAASAETVMGEGRQPCVEALPAGTGAAEGSSSRARWPCWPGPSIAPSRRCRPGRRSGWLPARPGQWQHLLCPPAPLGGRRDPAAVAPPGAAGSLGGARPAAGPRPRRRAAVPGVGRGAGGGARGVRGRGGVQLSLALLVVTARQAHIPSGSRSLSPFCFPTIELRWKQKIEGV